MYKIVKLRFSDAVHFGSNSLEQSKMTFCADTLYSALYMEALSIGQEENLYQSNFLISDALPFCDDELYLPKPLVKIEPASTVATQNPDARVLERKLYKAIEYIPLEKFLPYLSGLITNPTEELAGDFGVSQLVGKAATRTGVSDDGSNNNARPFNVDTFRFTQNAGLYFIICCQDCAVLELMEELLKSLQYKGIGGKRSAGLGSFELLDGVFEDVPEMLAELLKADTVSKQMALTTCLPLDNELDKTLKGANYLLIKRSGFVASDTYAKSYLRKRDIYKFAIGSVFSERFAGQIADVSISRDEYKAGHPVYSYAKPLFVGFECQVGDA